MIVFLAIAVAAFVYGFMQLLDPDEAGGWQEIQASSGAELNCGGDFVLLYDLGGSGSSVSAEKKGLTSAYTGAAVTAYRLFTNDGDFEDVHNVRYINRHPNEVIDVDPALYHALEQVQAAGDRSLYLGPVYEIYNGVFTCEDDAQTADFDPLQNGSLRAYFAECAAFGGDPASVDVELLGDGEIRLAVSEEYLAFAQEEEIVSFIDFGWMKNAFIADYLADTLANAGYTRGALSSCDGFVRNLCQGGETFAFNIFDRGVRAGAMTYTGPMSIVYLRSYPMNELDAANYYEMSDGGIRSYYLDPADGLCKTALDDLMAYACDGSCAGTALALAPLYVADGLDAEGLSALAERGVFSVTCGDGEVRYNDPDLTFEPEEGYSAVCDE